MAAEEKTKKVIASFVCKRDSDIEVFLKDKAIQFEKNNKSKTYFLADKNQLKNGEFVLLAYFTVALQVFGIVELGLSNRRIKELDGFSAKKEGSVITNLPVFFNWPIGEK